MDGVANLYALQWVGFALHVAAIALVWPSLRARPMLVGTGMAVAAWWLGQRAPAAWITSLREGFTRDHLRFVAGQGTQAGPLLQAVWAPALGLRTLRDLVSFNLALTAIGLALLAALARARAGRWAGLAL
ncbi:MAG TPA: hypothetical protein PKA64_26065, partial [Myxococcota bacterium]|nr:hypothetical protein [Myxococcota bacterium]